MRLARPEAEDGCDGMTVQEWSNLIMSFGDEACPESSTQPLDKLG
jgi:hypothetical protein